MSFVGNDIFQSLNRIRDVYVCMCVCVCVYVYMCENVTVLDYQLSKRLNCVYCMRAGCRKGFSVIMVTY